VGNATPMNATAVVTPTTTPPTPAASGVEKVEKEKLYNLWVHDESMYPDDLVVQEGVLPSDYVIGDIVEIFHPDKDKKPEFKASTSNKNSEVHVATNLMLK